MDEKIKISLSKDTLELLKKDCLDFKIVKADGKANMNSFINTLIANFYESFAAGEETLHEDLKNALATVPEYYREKVFLQTLKVITKRTEGTGEKKDSAILSFKPTKVSEMARLYVESILIPSESLSSFYRRMFTAYAQKTKNEREKIIHKEALLLLQKAIKRGVQVCVQLQNGDVLQKLSVHSIPSSKEELFNYVLFYNGKNNVTIRLASVQSVALLSQAAFMPEENRAMFDRQVACAPQYPIYSTDNEPMIMLSKRQKK